MTMQTYQRLRAHSDCVEIMRRNVIMIANQDNDFLIFTTLLKSIQDYWSHFFNFPCLALFSIVSSTATKMLLRTRNTGYKILLSLFILFLKRGHLCCGFSFVKLWRQRMNTCFARSWFSKRRRTFAEVAMAAKPKQKFGQNSSWLFILVCAFLHLGLINVFFIYSASISSIVIVHVFFKAGWLFNISKFFGQNNNALATMKWKRYLWRGEFS